MPTATVSVHTKYLSETVTRYVVTRNPGPNESGDEAVMIPSVSPLILKRWIALELRRIRENAGISRQQVADRLQCVQSHVTHLETVRNLPRAPELEVLLAFYDVADRTPLFLDMLAAARKGKNKNWWTAYQSAVPKEFDLFLGLESSAARIDSYDAMVVPGVFQLPTYTEAIIRHARPELSDAEVTARMELRLARQQVLDRTDPAVRVWSVLDESVLRRRVGGATVAAEQLAHLVELSTRPNVEIQVLPAATGTHPGIEGSFQILSFPPELVNDPGVAYVETRMQAIYYEKAEEITEYRDVLTRLQVQALTPDESRSVIEHAAEDLRP